MQYKKIDIFVRRADGVFHYVASTTWSRTCREARARYASKHGLNLSDVKAWFSR